MQDHRQLRPARIDAQRMPDRATSRRRRVYRSASARRHRIVLIAVALAGSVLAVGSAITPEGLRSASLPEVGHRISDHLSFSGNGASDGDALDGVGEDDGYVAEGGSVSPYADDLPAIAKLDAPLRAAVQRAARDAEGQSIEIVVTSGWRSAAYQRLLARRAEREYGAEEARKLVLPPEQSAHVQGHAVDIGHTDGADWMSRHGSAYGLCQIYTNELWHYELATEPGGQCPMQRSDASSS